MNERKSNRWLLIFVVFPFLFASCDDPPDPNVRYLGPPIVEAMNVTGQPHKLDAWTLDDDGYPISASFGWEVSYQWEGTGDDYTEPGIHTTFAIMGRSQPTWSLALESSITGTGCGAGGDPEQITAVSDNDGLAIFYLSLHNWPYQGNVANHINVRFHTNGRPHNVTDDPQRSGDFGQNMTPFFETGGGWQMSYQDWYTWSPASRIAHPIPDFTPMALNPAFSPPKVPIAYIEPMEAECRALSKHPDSKGAGGGDFLIRSQWMKLRLVDNNWVLRRADFIGVMPCEPNFVESVANTAWPYTVSFHAPAESAGLGVIDAELSIVAPNGRPRDAIDIQIHEVGQCVNCGEWLWRSDYVIPLTGPASGSLSVQTSFGSVIVAWLPRGYNMKIEPVVNARTIYILSRAWLARNSVLDLDEDGIVNFSDYSLLLGMR